MPLSVRTGPASAATNVTRAPGSRLSTSYGPIASSAVKPSYSRIAVFIVSSPVVDRRAPGARPRVRVQGVRLRDAARLEAAAVLGRADVERAQEHAAHRLGRAEAARGSDGCDRLVAVLEPPARGLEPHALDVARRRHAGLGAKGAREVARAHLRSRGHRLDRVLAGDVLDDAALDLAQRLARGLLRRERRAELRLVARPAQEQHEMPRDRQRRARGRSPARPARARDPCRQSRRPTSRSARRARRSARRRPRRADADARARRQPTSASSRAARRAGPRRRARTRRCRPMPCAARVAEDAAIHSSSAASAEASRAPRPPGTISVSIASGACASAAVGRDRAARSTCAPARRRR